MDDLTPPHWGAPDQHVIEPCPNPWCHSHKTTDAEIRSFEAPIVEPSRSSFEKRVSCPCCPMSGPWANTETEAIAAWNHRPLVQQAIAAERGEPVAVPHVVYDMKMPPYHYQKPYTGSGGSISVPSAPPTEAQIRADERERCAKVAEGYVGSTPPRYESGIERRATTSQQADNCLNAIKVRAATIAAAIRSLKEADNGAGNECICPKCGLRHGGKVDSGAVF